MKRKHKLAAALLALSICQVPVCAGTETSQIPDGYTVFTFSEDGIVATNGVDGSYEIKNGELTIKAAGDYALCGSSSNGSVTVKKGTTDVTLLLKDLRLSSASGAALICNKNTEVDVEAVGENTLSDTVYNNDETYPDNSYAENAVLKAKEGGTLKIGGSGKLNLLASGKNGLKSNAALTIDGADISIKSVDDGISCESSVDILSGNIQIEADGDGIKSAADDTPHGQVSIQGGTISVVSKQDAIQATKLLEITGGKVSATTYGGYQAVYDGDDDAYPSAKGLKAGGSYEVEDEDGVVNEIDATDCAIVISGGTITLDCADDAIHSDKDVTITGGDFKISSGDDGIHADYITTIGTLGKEDDALSVLIENSCEAIEGAAVNIHSGNMEAYAYDDGVNAANADLKNYSHDITITGGKLFVSCSAGDGLDANSNLTISGGQVVVCGNAGLGEGNPLDCDGRLSITNATVLAIGTGNMASNPSEGLYVVYGSTGGFGGPRYQGNTATSSIAVKDKNVVAIKDASGNTVFEATAGWNKTNNNCKATYVLFSSPKLVVNSSYSLYVEGTSAATSTVAEGTGGTTGPGTNPGTTPDPGTNPGTTPDPGTDPGTPPDPGTDPVIDPGTDPGAEPRIGDVNMDGQVNLLDAQLVLKGALGIQTFFEVEKAAADVDGSGVVNLLDAQITLKMALGITE